MPLKRALGVRETVAGRRLGALEGGGYPPALLMHPPPPPCGAVMLDSLLLRLMGCARSSACTAPAPHDGRPVPRLDATVHDLWTLDAPPGAVSLSRGSGVFNSGRGGGVDRAPQNGGGRGRGRGGGKRAQLNLVKFFSTQNDDFYEPPRRADSTNPISIFFTEV